MPILQDPSEYDVNKAMDGHEGCNIYGWLDLQRVAGSFRISVHIEDFFQLAKASPALPGHQVSRPQASVCIPTMQIADIVLPPYRSLHLSPYTCWVSADSGVDSSGTTDTAGTHGRRDACSAGKTPTHCLLTCAMYFKCLEAPPLTMHELQLSHAIHLT